MTDAKIRKMIKVSGVPQWKVAETIGITPSTLCVWVRSKSTLTAERELRIVRALEQLKGAQNGDNQGITHRRTECD